MLAIYFAARDPRTPWYAKALAFCVAGYALSPIDLIPDFVPVMEYLDDLVIVPLGNAGGAEVDTARDHGGESGRCCSLRRAAGEPHCWYCDRAGLGSKHRARRVGGVRVLSGLGMDRIAARGFRSSLSNMHIHRSPAIT